MLPLKYPDVSKADKDYVEVYHGTLIADPYRYLEDPQSSETKTFLTAQNNLTNFYLNSCEKEDHQKIKNGLMKLCNFSEIECPFRRGQSYFYFRDSILYKLGSLDDLKNSQVVLDVFSESILSGWSNISIASSLLEKTGEVFGNFLVSVSNDGSILAFGISESGSVWNSIYFKDLKTGECFLEDTLEQVQDTYLSWTLDNKGLFYGRYPRKSQYTNQCIYYHRLGTDQSLDRLVLELPSNPNWELKSKVSDCGEYLISFVLQDCSGNTMVNLSFVQNLLDSSNQANQASTEPSAFIPLISQFDGDYDYITNSGSRFYFLTNKNAPNSMVIAIDVDLYLVKDNTSTAKAPCAIVKEHSKDVLEWAVCVNQKYLLLCYMRDVASCLQIRSLRDGSHLHTFSLEIGSIVGHSGRRNDSAFFLKFASFLNPGEIYHFDFNHYEEENEITQYDCMKSCMCSCTKRNNFQLQLFKKCEVESFRPQLYKTRQIFYKSKDGTLVPMFLVYKKPLIKYVKNLCVLYGYGGFRTSLTPTFDPTYIAIVKHLSGIVAVANIRGGGEYGKSWYEAGIHLKKQNSFDDFLSAAEYLIKKGYTSADKLVICGNSNGGLLVGACVNQRPELFAGAVAGYGVMDLLRFHKFTTGSCWISDYGCSDNEMDFKNLLKISPLHNVRMPEKQNAQYPAMLLITADHDEKVLPLHSYKMIAELQEKIGRNPKQTNPLLIRIERNAGHGDGMSLDDSVDEVTDILSFIMLTIGCTFEN